MTANSKRIAAWILLAVLLGVNVVVVIWRMTPSTPPLPAREKFEQARLKAAAPELFSKIETEVARLEGESLADSLAKLSDVNQFYWPGPTHSGGGVVHQYVPLPENVGQSDLEAIMSNRRFRKMLDELSQVDTKSAAKQINDELSAALTVYLALYQAELTRFLPLFDLDTIPAQGPLVGPTFAIDNVPAGEITIAGTRLKILALAWTAGLLGLSDARDQVDQVARRAIMQRTELYENPNLHPFFKGEMLKLASLYNRQILVSALLIVAGEPLATSVLNETGATWQTHTLASYKAAVTEFDLPVQSGAAKPDYSLGSRVVKFVSPLDDDEFDLVMAKLKLVP